MRNTFFDRTRSQANAQSKAFLSILLTAICLALTLLSAIIDKWVYPFGSEMLSPALAQIILLLIPTYLCIMLSSPEKSATEQMRGIGIGRLRAEHIFFMIFATMFAITTALLLNMIFGGVAHNAKGFTLLATFTAGKGDYSSSYPYLIFVYALIPAVAEEVLFRGLIFSETEKISRPSAVCISSILYALFAFSLGNLPSALILGGIYCFALITTEALQACIIVHFIYNLFSLFLGTNISAFFTSSPSKGLLLVIAIAAWILSTALFFGESARIYREKAKNNNHDISATSAHRLFSKDTLSELLGVVTHKPTLICLIACILLYATILIIS
jgi:membrane protease YdiL (CAAX protease family)